MWYPHSTVLRLTGLMYLLMLIQGDEDCKKMPDDLSHSVMGCCDMVRNRTELNPKPDLVKEINEFGEYCQKAYTKARKESPDSTNVTFEGFNCLYDCLFVKTGLMSEDGAKLNHEKIYDIFNLVVSTEIHEDLAEIAVASARKCLVTVEITVANNYKDAVCQPKNLRMFDACTHLEIAANCPASRFQNEDSSCQTGRDFLQKCLADIVKTM